MLNFTCHSLTYPIFNVLIWPISSHPIKMWARSDGRFEKSVLQVYNRILHSMFLNFELYVIQLLVAIKVNYIFKLGGDLWFGMLGSKEEKMSQKEHNSKQPMGTKQWKI